MYSNNLCYVFFILLLLRYGETARILGAVFTPSYSHQLTFRPIWKELSLRGHQVTLLTTDPLNDLSLTNLNEIDLSESYEIMKAFNTDEAVSSNERSFWNRSATYMNALNAVADAQLSHPQVKALIKNESEHFDLVMVEAIYPTQMAFAVRFQAPFIGLMSLDAPPRLHAAMGNPIHPVVYPDYTLPFNKDLTFIQRLISTGVLGFMLLYGDYKLYPREDLTVKKHFGENMPSLTDIQNNMSMLFINVNPVLHNIRPLAPTTIQIGGGFHFKQDQQVLPKDIQKYLDGATNGFVYFSLGTNVKSASLSPQLRKTILEGLRELPYKVLWKFEDEHVPDKPSNVKIVKWVPQLAILGHRHIKAFVTQCGLQSMEEAIFYHVPMIGLPFYGDQPINAKVLETKGLGKKLNYATLTKQEFVDALTEVISNPDYRDRLKEIAELATDEEMSGLEKAVWWTEYVIRHKGAKHLRCAVVDLPFYKYYCLDVIGFLLITTYLCIKLPLLLFKRIFCSKKEKMKVQ